MRQVVHINQEWYREMVTTCSDDEAIVLFSLLMNIGHPVSKVKFWAKGIEDDALIERSIARFVEDGYLSIREGIVCADPDYAFVGDDGGVV